MKKVLFQENISQRERERERERESEKERERAREREYTLGPWLFGPSYLGRLSYWWMQLLPRPLDHCRIGWQA